MDLFNLSAILSLDRKDFDRGIEEAEGKGKGLSKKLKDSFGSIKKLLFGAATIAAIKKGVSAIASQVKAVSDYGDAVDKQSQKLGMSARNYQIWANVLEKNGASIESLGTGMKTLNSAILSGSDESEAAFKKLGLSANQLKRMSQEDAFNAVVMAFTKLPDGAQKSALAVQLFGRSGMELLPTLNMTSDEIADLQVRAIELGAVMSDMDVKAAATFNDSLTDLGTAMNGVRNKIFSQFLPSLTTVTDAITDVVIGKEGGMKKFEKGISQLVDKLAAVIPKLIQRGGKLLGAIGNGISILFSKLWPKVSAFIVKFIKDLPKTINSALTTLGNAIVDILNEAFGFEIPHLDFTFIQDALQWFLDNKEPLVIAIGAIIGAFAAAKIAEFVSSISPLGLILTLVAGGIALVAANWDKIKDWIGKAWNTVVTWVQNGWKAVKDAFTSAKEWVAEKWKAVVTWTQEKWSSIKEAFQNAKAWADEKREAVISWVQEKWADVQSAFSTVGEWISGTAKEIALNFVSTVDSWITTIKGVLSGKVKFKDLALNFVSTVADWIQRIWNWVTGNTDENNHVVIDFGATIADWIETISKWLAGIGLGQITINFGAKVSGWLKTVKDWTTKGIDVIVNFFTGRQPTFPHIDSGSGDVNQDAVRSAVSGMGRSEGEAYLKLHGLTYNEDSNMFERVSGGQAKGMDFVPYDDYVTRLHRGEAVLSGNEAYAWRQSGGRANNYDGSSAIVTAIQGLSNDLQNLRLYVGERAFAGAVVDYSGRRMDNYLGESSSRVRRGYGRR